MDLLLQEIPASELSPKTTQETPPPGKDPLIAEGLQKEQYVNIIGVAICPRQQRSYRSRCCRGISESHS